MSGKLDITVGVVKPQSGGNNNETDAVLKTGDITLDGLNLSIEDAVFAWRLNKVEFNPGAHTTTLDPTTDEYIRYDLLVGTSQGNYAIKKGIQGELSANIPTANKGTIALAVLALKGNNILQIIPEPVIDLSSIENRITVLENFNPSPETGLTGQAFAVWSGTGLKYYARWPIYYIEGVSKPAANDDITLEPTTSMTAGQKRYDLIILDANGLNKITGTPDENPVLPTIDTETQIIITNILLNEGDVIPSDNTAVREQIYDDNVEWTVSRMETGVTINPNYTGQAFKGVKSLQITNFGSGREHIVFDKVNPNSFTKTFLDFNALTFRIYLPSSLNSNIAFDIWFEKQSGSIGKVGRVTSIFDFKTGKFGFNESVKNTWQLIIIPLSVFEISDISFNSLWLRREAGDRNCLLDDIALVGANVIESTTKQKAITTIVTNDGVYVAETPEDIIEIIGINGIAVKGSGKKIEIDVKKATDAISGTVKTDIPEVDPVVYSKNTTDNLLKAKVNAILEIKPITGIAYELTAYDTTNLVELIYEDTLPMTVTIPNDATLNLPVGSIFYTVATNTGALSIAGGAGVAFQTAVGLTAGQNEVRKYVKKAANVWGIEGGAGVITSTAKTPYTVFIDTVNGNDATAKIEDPTKPFKTDSAAYTALPTDNGNAWNFHFICNNVTRNLLQIPSNRKIKYFCYNIGTFNISTWIGVLDLPMFYFEIENATLIHSSSSQAAIYSSTAACYIRCKTLTVATPPSSVFGFIFGNKKNDIFLIDQLTQTNATTGYPVFGGGNITVDTYNTTSTRIAVSQGNDYKFNIKELILNGQICSLSLNTNTYFRETPFRKISGTGVFNTTGLSFFDVTNINSAAGITIAIDSNTKLTGKENPTFLATITLSVNGINIHDYYGKITGLSDINLQLATVNIKNSTLFLTTIFYTANAIADIPGGRIWYFNNVEFIQTTPGTLFSNIKTSSTLSIQKTGFFKSNGTIPVQVVVTERTANSF